MTTKTAKIAPVHILLGIDAGADAKPLCGVRGKAEGVGVHEIAKATCKRCLARKAAVAAVAAPAAPAPADAKESLLVAVVEQMAAEERAAAPAPKAKAPKAKAPKAKRAARKVEPKPIRTHLLDPEFTYSKTGHVESITGTCTECKKAKRTIGPADAFQVRRCEACQKKAIARRVAAYRKAKRAAARRAAK